MSIPTKYRTSFGTTVTELPDDAVRWRNGGGATDLTTGDPYYAETVPPNAAGCTIGYPHCCVCGGQDEATPFNEGYSSCCNKRITDHVGCDNLHDS